MAAALADPLMERAVWLACAAPLARLPTVGAKVFYYARGHADQCPGVDLPPALHLHTVSRCTVQTVDLYYRLGTDEPYAEISLLPDQELNLFPAATQQPEPTTMRYYVKHLSCTSDDRSPVPIKSCALSLFPPLHGNPDQILQSADMHGEPYNVTHHLRDGKHRLTAGWGKYCSDKALRLFEDAAVFIRPRAGENRFLIGSRRGSGPRLDIAMELLPNVEHATEIAAVGADPFTVTYYPRQGWAFVVPRKEADDGLAIDWQPGMEVRMPIPVDAHEVPSSREDANTPGFFKGTITTVNNTDWGKLQVNWANSSAPTPNSPVNAWQVQAIEPSSGKRTASSTTGSDVPSSSRQRII